MPFGVEQELSYRQQIARQLRTQNCDDMLSRFHLIPERNGQTDGRTDRFAISISRVSMPTRDKNYM